MSKRLSRPRSTDHAHHQGWEEDNDFDLNHDRDAGKGGRKGRPNRYDRKSAGKSRHARDHWSDESDDWD